MSHTCIAILCSKMVLTEKLQKQQVLFCTYLVLFVLQMALLALDVNNKSPHLAVAYKSHFVVYRSRIVADRSHRVAYTSHLVADTAHFVADTACPVLVLVAV